MKKICAIILAICMGMAFSACEIDDTPKKEQSSPEAEVESKDETFGLNETAVFNNMKITATVIEESDGENFFNPEDGNVFVGVKFTIENTSDKEQTISTLLQFEGYADDVKCDYSINAACVFDDGSLDGTVASGKKAIGWYALEVPADWETIEIDIKPDILSKTSAKFVFEK